MGALSPEQTVKVVERSADVGLRKERYQSLIAGALVKGEDEIVSALREAGADAGGRTPSGRSKVQMFGRPHLQE